MKKKVLYILFGVFLLSLLIFFIHDRTWNFHTSNIETDVEESVGKLSDDDIKGLIEKRITYSRNNLRYEKQQEELEKVLDIFNNNKDALEIVARSFLNGDKTTGIVFHLSPSYARFYANEAKKHKSVLRCLMVLDSGVPSFRYSDLYTYLIVKNDPNLEAAIKTLDSDFVYASFYINYAMFTLNQRYFKEKEKINFIFYFDTDGVGYLSENIRAADGWNIEIVGYNQHYRDINLETNIPSDWDDAYPF